MKPRVTPESAREILDLMSRGIDPSDTELKQIFTGRKKHLLIAFSKGFKIGDEDSSNDNEFTAKEFNRYYSSITSCRVWTKNKYKRELSDLIDRLRKQPFKEYEDNQLLHFATRVHAKVPDRVVEWFQPKQYESFYGKNVEHEVDMVNDLFFTQYPKAKRTT